MMDTNRLKSLLGVASFIGLVPSLDLEKEPSSIVFLFERSIDAHEAANIAYSLFPSRDVALTITAKANPMAVVDIEINSELLQRLNIATDFTKFNDFIAIGSNGMLSTIRFGYPSSDGNLTMVSHVAVARVYVHSPQ